MAPVKIIFFDIDGTLVNPRTGRVSDETILTLTRLQEQGILICISTGRSPAGIPDLGPVKFDAYCTYNGALCYTDSEVIHSDPLTSEDVAQVLHNAAEIGRPVSVAVRHRLAANGLDPDLADYYRLAELELTVAPDFDAVCQEAVYQIMLGCRNAEHAAIIKDTHGVKLAISWDRAVDVISSSSDKGVAISKVLAHFGLDASQAMAFGDSLNDLEMLKTVGIGVAMGNAIDQLKATADDVCGPVDENGIYHYCVARGLI